MDSPLLHGNNLGVVEVEIYEGKREEEREGRGRDQLDALRSFDSIRLGRDCFEQAAEKRETYQIHRWSSQ